MFCPMQGCYIMYYGVTNKPNFKCKLKKCKNELNFKLNQKLYKINSFKCKLKIV